MVEYAARLGVRVIEAPLPAGRHGACLPSLDRVVVDPRLTYRAERVTIVHELVHWEHGDTGCGHERRTRLETARILVDPLDYQLAERAYGTDIPMIAAELAVTPHCIMDWLAWAHDAMPAPPRAWRHAQAIGRTTTLPPGQTARTAPTQERKRL